MGSPVVHLDRAAGTATIEGTTYRVAFAPHGRHLRWRVTRGAVPTEADARVGYFTATGRVVAVVGSPALVERRRILRAIAAAWRSQP